MRSLSNQHHSNDYQRQFKSYSPMNSQDFQIAFQGSRRKQRGFNNFDIDELEDEEEDRDEPDVLSFEDNQKSIFSGQF